MAKYDHDEFFNRKKPTNADRIRAMSDVELAKFIGSIVTVDYDPYMRIKGKIIKDELEWLQQEVEE